MLNLFYNKRMNRKHRVFSLSLATFLLAGARLACAQAVVTTAPTYSTVPTYSSGMTTTTGVPTGQTITTTTVPGAMTVPNTIGTAAVNAAAVQTQQLTAQATASGVNDLSRYAAMVGQQGANGQQQQQPQQQVKYYYKPTDPNDPLASVQMPKRLFNNIPDPDY